MRPAADLDLPLALDRSTAVPLHLQLAAGLREAASTGLLPPGSRMPPTRLLARRLGVARSTVVAAYEQLDGEGHLQARHGSGTYLTASSPAPSAPSLLPSPSAPPVPPVPPVPSARSGTATAPSSPPAAAPRPPAVLDLRPGQPGTARLADPAWQRAWRAATAAAPPTWEPPSLGLPRLREEVAAHLRAARGLAADPDDVVVTAGTSEALSLLAWALPLRGESVAVEDPGHPAARRSLVRHGAALVPVPVDDDGLVVDALPTGRGAPRAVLTTPSHQYPLGGRMPVARRLALLAWAERCDAVVVEDDYDSEFRFDVAPLPALAGLDRAGRTVHVGTFSKVLTPWLRIGYLVAPPWLRPALRDARTDLGTVVSGVDQQALAAYLAAGGLRRHVARCRRDHARTRAHLTRRLAQQAPGVRLRGLDGGLHAVLELPPGARAARVVARAGAAGLRVADLDEYRVRPLPQGAAAAQGVVLGYGSATAADVDRAVAVLAHAVRAEAVQVEAVQAEAVRAGAVRAEPGA
ncbi:PLP-dependent aminotransferase family protein [Quadrisphaera sp. DSM 44207]|uniref:MocR-like pyridoxine biosynthesis transcription factor PdxR n=1 Tax=Quadrisphaera sp. DSM 44207 TaxID=1881057 RepID=UPI00088BD669|nr:PLP-dependent aminotransferase family protein [Quadrisphaera sp. DSM 44207]SDQ04187.1 GntR family transcriptional regulator / MocR family aminotransferase [Quadrisphaera sp. DSM 44207]